jgi:pimeloyl-ACP methyl ester carboxylesterase
MLAATHRVVALDLPGFGYSGRLARYGADSYAHFIHAFLDALGLEQVDLVGHSMGGQIAIAAAAARPERVRRLVLVASAGLPRHGSRWLAPVAVLTDRSTYHLRLYPTMLRLTRHARAMRECYHMLLEDSVFGLLSDLTMPTLIIWGSRDRLVPLEDATLLARGIPNSRLVIMRGCGHLPFYQKPRQFERIIQKFLSDQ